MGTCRCGAKSLHVLVAAVDEQRGDAGFDRRLYSLIDEVGESHEPVQINGKRGNGLLLSEADWNTIQKTLHLVAMPGMRESILEGLATPLEDLIDQPGW